MRSRWAEPFEALSDLFGKLLRLARVVFKLDILLSLNEEHEFFTRDSALVEHKNRTKKLRSKSSEVIKRGGEILIGGVLTKV